MTEEHELCSAIFPSQNARCTVCIKCGKLWWTPAPTNPESYSPRFCIPNQKDALALLWEVWLLDPSVVHKILKPFLDKGMSEQ